MVADQFGMAGLLTFIRVADSDPNLVSLALGSYFFYFFLLSLGQFFFFDLILTKSPFFGKTVRF